MFNKKFFLVAAGYIAGGIVSSLYNKKKPKELKQELLEKKEAGEGEFKLLLANFVDTHKNLLLDVEKSILSDENKALFNEKKAELLKIADIYKAEGNNLLLELQSKGKDYLVEASDKLEKLYKEKKGELESIKEVSPEKASELKDNLFQAFQDIKEKMIEKFDTVEKINKKDK
ncbi:MAG: hypothetical protein GY828_01145 [Candidatus Gracilibacteria bacterium]|nr:hypothetical protein [Candidatus Gracilibacteria bacterium]